MKSLLSLVLIGFGIGQYMYIGYNIFSFMLMILLCFVGGFIGGMAPTRVERDSNNIADLAQIERNRYFRKRE